MPKKESYHSTRRIKAACRENQAVEGRKEGLTYAQIAARIAESEGTTKLMSIAGVGKLLKRSLSRLRAHNRLVTDDLRQFELERLDTLLQGLWAGAKAGEEKAVQQTLAVLDRRYKLLGIEAPQRHEHSAEMTFVQLMTSARARIGEGAERIIDAEATEVKLLGEGGGDNEEESDPEDA